MNDATNSYAVYGRVTADEVPLKGRQQTERELDSACDFVEPIDSTNQRREKFRVGAVGIGCAICNE